MKQLTGIVVALTLLPHACAGQRVGGDIPPGHWAYRAVQDLAAKGLIQGYPPDHNFLGGRTMTRYEMATIVERIVARMDDLVGSKASKSDVEALRSTVGEINDLVNNFKVELAVIGGDMTKAKSDIAVLQGHVSDLDSRVSTLEKSVAAARNDASDARKDASDARSAAKSAAALTSSQLGHKVDIGTGKLKITGDVQTWYGTALGAGFGGGALHTFGGGTAISDTFRLRRGEIQLVGGITPRVDYRVLFDVAKIVSLNTTSAVVGGSGVLTGASVNAASNPLQDLVVGYQLNPRLRLEIGQQKTGLSEEGTRSATQLLTVERSIMNLLPATNGRPGDVHETGAALRWQGAGLAGLVGIWDDNGAAQNSLALDRQKFLSYSAYYGGLRHMTLGLWGGTSVNGSKPSITRQRLGATFIGQVGPHYFETEAGYADDASLAGTRDIALGGYALYALKLDRRWQVVGRYDQWDPAEHGGFTLTSPSIAIPVTAHNMREYTFGFNYYILGHNAKIQLDYVREDPQVNGIAAFGKPRSIILSAFDIAY